jgi:poly(hydroxyalkanoate) granule-associated protein
MAKKVEKVEEEVAEQTERHPLLEPVRRVLMASIGAVALAQDEIEAFVNKLIERGEVAEEDGRKLVRDLMDRRKERVEQAEEELDTRIEKILGRMNIPTKSDIQSLSTKITALAKKVDELTKA